MPKLATLVDKPPPPITLARDPHGWWGHAPLVVVREALAAAKWLAAASAPGDNPMRFVLASNRRGKGRQVLLGTRSGYGQTARNQLK